VRDAIRHCIYGVDLNPLAVELCKVALWLEAHNPGEPLNFLDHRIKCGNAIIGLAHQDELKNGIANEAFKTLQGDDKEITQSFASRNKKDWRGSIQYRLNYLGGVEKSLGDILETWERVNLMPEITPDEIEAKYSTYCNLISGYSWWKLKALADIQTAQFFISKTADTKSKLITDADYRQYLNGEKPLQDPATAMALTVAAEHRFFHWFLEFPEIFACGGFDCIVGNPPFLGGQKLSGTFGPRFLEYIKHRYAPIGAVDLVTYFFRRNFTLARPEGFISLIATNTIAQGGAREGGLDVIVREGGSIVHAVRSMKWPGAAAVEVALVTIFKGAWTGKCYLAGREVARITPYLDDAAVSGNPYPLRQNAGKSFQGSIVLGKGFILEPDEARRLIARDPRNRDALFPYLNGDDLNNNPDQSPSRWVINFFDWEEEKAREYPDCYEIVERLVKPERLKMKGDRGAKYWWQFLRIWIACW